MGVGGSRGNAGQVVDIHSYMVSVKILKGQES